LALKESFKLALQVKRHECAYHLFALCAEDDVEVAVELPGKILVKTLPAKIGTGTAVRTEGIQYLHVFLRFEYRQGGLSSMNAVTMSGDRRMTVREVAEALGVHIDTIHSWLDKLYPGLKRNGLTCYLCEEEVTRIKQAMNQNYSLRNAPKVTTDLEMAEKTVEVISWYMAKLEAATVELAIARPKAEAADALMASTQTMSITDAAKHFGLHPKAEVFPYLRARGYLTEKDLPTQSAINAGYLSLRETKCLDGECRPQAVVLVSQLDTWRQRVVPQIKAWVDT
jgi:phage antirepressor YoqD-like protein